MLHNRTTLNLEAIVHLNWYVVYSQHARRVIFRMNTKFSRFFVTPHDRNIFHPPHTPHYVFSIALEARKVKVSILTAPSIGM